MWDCVIVGAGPAGLTAATYLGRFLRKVVVIDSGESRMKRIPLTRNAPGFPEGIEGGELYARMLRQATLYGATFVEGWADRIIRANDRFQVAAAGQTFEAKTVLLATGAELVEPEMADLDEAVKRGLVRYCPVCDAFEAQNKSIAVLRGRANALEEAKFLRTYSDRVTVLWRAEAPPTASELEEAVAASVEMAPAPIVSIDAKHQIEVSYETGARQSFDVVYPCLGCDPRSELAKGLGARVSKQGGVIVDTHQRTSVTGLYAAGDVLQGLDQIASACGQAAIAATAIHNDLRAISDQ